ncbi:MAG: hypothetical protein MJA82_18270 [Clostridia bacterium]|nr:hypothetical protein [Clostridia bacterium]
MRLFKKLTFIFIILIIFFSSSILVFADDGPNIGERILMGIINSNAESMENIGISIDNLVYGEPDASGKKSPIIFELKKDNIMARITIDMYKLFRALAVMLMFTVGSIMAIKVMFSGTSIVKMSAKEMFTMYCISFLLIFLMPYIINAGLYLKDVLVSMIRASSPTGMAFVDTLKENALSDQAGVFETFLYFSGVILSLWFAFVYTSIGMTLAALLIGFPIFALFMNGERTKFVIGNWTKEVTSLVFIPVIDATILLIPMGILALKGIPDGQRLIYTLFAIANVMPLRTMIRRITGAGGSMAELAGLGFMMAAGNLFTKAVGGTKSVVSGGYKGMQDMKTASYYDKMSQSSTNSSSSFTQEGDPGSTAIPGTSASTTSLSKVKPLSSLNMDSYMQKTSKSKTSTARNADPLVDKYSQKYSNESWISNIDMPLNNKEKARLYRRRGLKNIGMSLGKTGAGMFGAAGGAVAFAGFGPAGIARGAQMGGSLGGLVGEGAGFLGGTGADHVLTNVNESARYRKEQDRSESKKNTSADDIKVETEVKTKPLKGEVSSGQSGLPAAYENTAYSGNKQSYAAIGGRTAEEMAQEVADIVTNDLPSEVDSEIRSRANATRDNYIQNYKDSGAWNNQVDKVYDEEISNMKEQGIEITPDIQVRVRNNSERYVNDVMHSDADAQGEYVSLQSRKAYYEKELTGRGYDSESISRISHLLEQKIHEKFEGYDFMDNEDIDINLSL